MPTNSTKYAGRMLGIIVCLLLTFLLSGGLMGYVIGQDSVREEATQNAIKAINVCAPLNTDLNKDMYLSCLRSTIKADF